MTGGQGRLIIGNHSYYHNPVLRPMASDPIRRMTPQRRIILDQIRNDRSHPTADEIYERVRQRLPRVSLGTVYRNLDILVSSGLIGKVKTEHPQMRFDGDVRDHYHITCMRCGRVEDAPMEPSDDTVRTLENALGRLTKYGIFGHKLEFVGLCSRCRDEDAQAQDGGSGDRGAVTGRKKEHP